MDGDHRHLLLLGLLRRQEMHGYQINEFLDGELAICSDLKKPTAYFLLNKMAEIGWVKQEESREGNRPVRHVFHITPDGEVAFVDLLRSNLATYEPTYFNNDIGLAMLDSLPVDEGVRLLQQRREMIVEKLSQTQATPTHTGSTQLVIEHHICHLESELSWIDRVIDQLLNSLKN